jgi:hypothetical protein
LARRRAVRARLGLWRIDPSSRGGSSQARFFGERDELLDGVEPALVTEGVEEAGADDVGLPAFADAAGEHALPERPPDQDAHAVALRGREDLALDARLRIE